MEVDAGLSALFEEHLEDVLGLVVAEQLAQLLLVIGHAVLADHGDEVPRRVPSQSRLVEVRVLREEVDRVRVHVGEVAAATTGHEDLLARLVGVVDEQHLAAACGGGHGTHQAGGTCADNHNVGRAHNTSSSTANFGVDQLPRATIWELDECPMSRSADRLRSSGKGRERCGLRH
jgi:hypothetical protein